MIQNKMRNNLHERPNQLLLIPVLLFALPSLLGCSQLIESNSRSQQDLQRSPKIEAHQSGDYVLDKKLATGGGSESVDREVHAREHNQTATQHEVTDLRLTADFRAAKLRWTYTHRRRNQANARQEQQAEQPASFQVRFCELTTWKTEIKCRHREMLAANQTADNSVITTNNSGQQQQQQLLTVLRRNNTSTEYEAQIFDLRALTNYTFHVRPLTDEQLSANISSDGIPISQRKPKSALDRRSMARHIPVGGEQTETNELVGRIETKPFRAEATKCLADVSEVVITTGKYFGGRISVENSLDKRCQLIGNKSSEQTSYTFKIDHEICHSKVINGNRIETLILVHENKDILTHNTARFLVLCNFLQKSFTLRASISLPKVNGIMSNRPAVITPLNGRPASKEQPVQLGSMPGIFRAKAHEAETLDSLSNISDTRSNHIVPNELDIIERNSIRKTLDQHGSNIDSRQRQPKLLLDQRQRMTSFQLPSRSQSMELVQAESSPVSVTVPIPEPVSVQSKLLHVERSPVANLVAARITQQNANSSSSSSSSLMLNQAEARWTNKSIDRQLAGRKSPAAAEPSPETDESIILTNNHRVVSNFKPTSSLKLAPPLSTTVDNEDRSADSADGGLSIKYSGAKVSEYPVGQLGEGRNFPPDDVRTTQSNDPESVIVHHHSSPFVADLRRGERTGRMQSIADSIPTRNQIIDSSRSSETKAETKTDRRMGDTMMIANGDLLAETSNNDSETVSEPGIGDNSTIVAQPGAGNSNIARNLTEYLLKWSLKTLTNLAKKSLESLANRSESADAASGDDAEEPQVATSVHQLTRPTPVLSAARQLTQHRTIVTPTTTTLRPSPVSSSSLSSSWSLKPETSTSDGFDTHPHSRPQQRVNRQHSTGSTPRPAAVTSTLAHVPTKTAATSADGARPTNTHATSHYHHHHHHQQQQQQQQQPQQQPNHRTSDYSKSLDLDRLETAAVRGEQSLATRAPPVGASDQTRDYLARTNESGQHIRHADREALNYSGSMSWLLVACLFILALLVGALAIFCLASSASSCPPNAFFGADHSHQMPASAHQTSYVPPKTVVSSLPRLVFNGTIVASSNHGQSSETLNSGGGVRTDNLPSYSARYDYNRFENNARDTSSSSTLRAGGSLDSSRNGMCPLDSSSGGGGSSSGSSIDGDSNDVLMLGNKQKTQSSSRLLPTVATINIGANPRSNRNTSQLAAGLTSTTADDDDENNCTRSELLLTAEHVLMSTNCRSPAPPPNESYA